MRTKNFNRKPIISLVLDLVALGEFGLGIFLTLFGLGLFSAVEGQDVTSVDEALSFLPFGSLSATTISVGLLLIVVATVTWALSYQSKMLANIRNAMAENVRLTGELRKSTVISETIRPAISAAAPVTTVAETADPKIADYQGEPPSAQPPADHPATQATAEDAYVYGPKSRVTRQEPRLVGPRS